MKPSILLRIAAIVALLFAAAHTLGQPWTTAKSAEAMALVDSMKSLHFDALGENRSYFDFYFGFGLSISIYLLVQAVLLWQLAGLSRTNAAVARPMVMVLLGSYVLNGALIWKYFFLPPLIMSLVIVVLLVLALVAKERPSATG